MRNWLQLLKLEENHGGDGGGAGSGDSKSEGEQDKPANNPPSEGEGDQFDDLGYPIDKKTGEEKPSGSGDDKKPPASKSEEKPPELKPEDALPGYGDDKKPVEEKPPTPPAPKEEVKLDYEINLETLPKEDADKLKEFAKKNGFSKEQAQAYADQRKAEIKSIADSQAEYQRERQAKVNGWVNELKNDPNFGGDKYAHNVQQVGKVLQEFMPEFKKQLTESGIVLPPNAIRGFKKIAEALYETKSMVQGDPLKGNREQQQENPDAFLDDMYPEKKS